MANEKRLIDAYTALKDIESIGKNIKSVKAMQKVALIMIEGQPTVDAVEVVHGEWIETLEIPSYSNKNIPVVECSKCRCFFCDIINVHSFMYHYCPNCGAKMDGVTEDG